MPAVFEKPTERLQLWDCQKTPKTRYMENPHSRTPARAAWLPRLGTRNVTSIYDHAGRELYFYADDGCLLPPLN